MLFKADTMVPLYWLTIASQLAVLDAHSVLYVLAAVPVLYMCSATAEGVIHELLPTHLFLLHAVVSWCYG